MSEGQVYNLYKCIYYCYLCNQMKILNFIFINIKVALNGMHFPIDQLAKSMV